MYAWWHKWQKKEMNTGFWWRNLQERDHLEDLRTDEKTILIWISKERECRGTNCINLTLDMGQLGNSLASIQCGESDYTTIH
jgi:hypothetical protein